MKRSKLKLKYHGRVGHPFVHEADTGKKYIMVRAPGGRGTKRLYLVHGRVPLKHQMKIKHRR